MSDPPVILITNDDGVHASGLAAHRAATSAFGAPSWQRRGVNRAPVRTRSRSTPAATDPARARSGTDVHAERLGYISVTPLALEATHDPDVELAECAITGD
jgi:broad specificity polyphosphatase/5'/3'-nucleotidase SurE